MEQPIPYDNSDKNTNLLMLIVALIVSYKNLNYYILALVFEVLIASEKSTPPGTVAAGHTFSTHEVVFMLEDVVASVTLFSALVMLIMFKRKHKVLGRPIRILLAIAVLQIVASRIILFMVL